MKGRAHGQPYNSSTALLKKTQASVGVYVEYMRGKKKCIPFTSTLPLQQTFPRQAVVASPSKTSPFSLSIFVAGLHFSARSVITTHKSSHIASSSHLHGHFLQNVKQTVKPELQSEKMFPVTAQTQQKQPEQGSQAANELLLDIWI